MRKFDDLSLLNTIYNLRKVLEKLTKISTEKELESISIARSKDIELIP